MITKILDSKILKRMGYSCFLTIGRRIWVFLLVGVLFIIVGLIFAAYGGVKYESKEETKIKQKVSLSNRLK